MTFTLASAVKCEYTNKYEDFDDVTRLSIRPEQPHAEPIKAKIAEFISRAMDKRACLYFYAGTDTKPAAVNDYERARKNFDVAKYCYENNIETAADAWEQFDAQFIDGVFHDIDEVIDGYYFDIRAADAERITRLG